MKLVLVLVLVLVACLACLEVTPDVRAHLARRRTVNIALHLAQQVDFERFDEEAAGVSMETKAHLLVRALQALAADSQPAVVRTLLALGVKPTQIRTLWLVNTIFIDDATNDVVVQLLRTQGDAIAEISSNEDSYGLIENMAHGRTPERREDVEWGLKWINADKVWEKGFKGKNKVVGGIDTGIHFMHPGIVKKYRGYTQGANFTHDHNWWDGQRKKQPGTCPAPVEYPCDDYGHGTHTVGTAVGSEDDHIFGVAPEAKWIGCRNLVGGTNSLERTLQCLQFMSAPTDLKGKNPNPSLRPHSTINSYRCGACSKNSMKQGFAAIKKLGIVMSVAAGNAGSRCGTVEQPGYLESTLAIAALNQESNDIASFSSRGPIQWDGNRRKPELSAPGVNVNSCVPPNKYQEMSGTSMATPHVSGVILLLWDAVPQIERDLDKTYALLYKTALNQKTKECGNKEESPNNVYGHGTVNVLKAVEEGIRMYGGKK